MIGILFDLTFTIVKSTFKGFIYLVTPNKKPKENDLIPRLIIDNSLLIEENMKLKDELEILKQKKE